MSEHPVAQSVGQPGAAPPLPASIWVVAWASLAGQVVLLVDQGVRLDDAPGDGLSLVLSVLLGALLVGYVSAGVVRARTFRLVLAWVLLVLATIAGVLDVVLAEDPEEIALAALQLATTVATLAGLARFHRSDWYAWQRTRPRSHEGAPIGSLVAVGVLVGALGGLATPVDDGLDVDVQVTDRVPVVRQASR